MFDVFLGFAFLASATVANKYALFVLSTSLMVGIRMLAAGLILFAFYYHKSHRLKFSYFKHDAVLLLGVTLLTMLVPALFKAYALKNMLSSKAAFLASLDPFVTAIYAFFFWSEKLTVKKIVGITLGFVGTFILICFQTGNEPMAWSIFSYPEIAALLAMAIGRLGWMFVQQLVRSERYTAGEINGLLMTISGIMAFIAPFVLAAFSLLLSYIPIINTFIPVYSFTDASHYLVLQNLSCCNPPMIIFAIAYTIIIGNVIGYTMYANFLKHHSATFVSLAGFSVPLYVYLFGNILLGEPLSLIFLVASAITFVGLMIFYQDEIKRMNHGHWL